MSGPEFPPLSLRVDCHEVISVKTPPAGELLSCRTTVCADDVTESFSIFSIFDFFFQKSYPLRHHNDEIKSLYGYHNPQIVRTAMAFNPPFLNGVAYKIQIRHAIMPNANADKRTSADLMIDSVNVNANMRIHGYELDGKGLVFAFDTHFGSKMIITVTAILDGKTVKTESLTVSAPHGDVFIPVPVFIEPFNNKSESTLNLLTFPSEGSFKVKRFNSADLILDLIISFYEGSVLQARYYRLFFHRDVPLLRHHTLGDVPLIEFVQKFTLQYPVDYGDEVLFHYYGDEERIFMEQMATYEDTILLVSTENGEFRRWIHLEPNVAAPEEAILRKLRDRYPQARTLLEDVNVLGYSGEEGCEVLLLPGAHATVLMQILSLGSGNAYDSVRVLTAKEDTPLRELVQEGKDAGIFTLFSNIKSFLPTTDFKATCKDMGVTWATSLAFALHADDMYSVVFGGSASAKACIKHVQEVAWNSLWVVDAPSMQTLYMKTFMLMIKYGDRTVMVPAAPTLPVFWVKLCLQEMIGVHVSQQRLMHEIHPCDDRCSLSSIHVHKGTMLELFIRHNLR